MLSELQGKNEEGGSRCLWLKLQTLTLKPSTAWPRGASCALEQLLESKLSLRWDESVTACHVRGITADYPVFYSGFKNYKDILLCQLQKQALKG